jgi:hypothetical protein
LLEILNLSPGKFFSCLQLCFKLFNFLPLFFYYLHGFLVLDAFERWVFEGNTFEVLLWNIIFLKICARCMNELEWLAYFKLVTCLLFLWARRLALDDLQMLFLLSQNLRKILVLFIWILKLLFLLNNHPLVRRVLLL